MTTDDSDADRQSSRPSGPARGSGGAARSFAQGGRGRGGPQRAGSSRGRGDRASSPWSQGQRRNDAGGEARRRTETDGQARRGSGSGDSGRRRTDTDSQGRRGSGSGGPDRRGFGSDGQGRRGSGPGGPDRRGSGSGAQDRRAPGRGGQDRRGSDSNRRASDSGRRDRRESAGRPDSAATKQWSQQPPSARAKTADAARSVAYQALRQVDESDAYANLVLPGLIRRAGLDSRDAGLATELTYGTLRRRGAYDAIIAIAADRPVDRIDPPVLDAMRLGVHQLLATRIPPHAALSQTVGLVRREIGSGASGFVNAVLRNVSGRSAEQWQEQILAEHRDPTERLALVHSHPRWIVRALRESLLMHGRPADDLAALLEADNEPPRVSLLARPGLADPAELIDAGAEPGRWSPYAATLPSGDPAGVAAVAELRARVQDEGSQLVALALAGVPIDGPDEAWLDLCAGPGGKTALLAGLAVERPARVVAIEPAPHRADLVRGGLMAGEPVEVRTEDGRVVGDLEPDRYDRVLVDAPCTGLGALRRRPEARWRRRPADLAALAPLQRELLTSGLRACRPGGVLAYVTCSPHPAETLLVVEDVLRAHPEVQLLDAPAALRAAAGHDIPGLGDGPTAQLWPHVHGTDAMFLALLSPR
ncbi:MAG: transcription antitermination factor NusB [Actinomycetales bacterium]